jgi:hypothetical protein
MKRFFLILALILAPSLSWAAITAVSDVTANNCESITSGTTLVCTTNQTVEAGNQLLVYTAFNNTGTTDADHSEVSSVTDSAGNTYTKVCEFTNGQGAAAAGITVSLDDAHHVAAHQRWNFYR